MPFNFFSIGVGVSIGAVQGGAGLIKKVQFPHEHLVFSVDRGPVRDVDDRVHAPHHRDADCRQQRAPVDSADAVRVSLRRSGGCLFASGNDQKAADNYQTALRLEPDAADLHSSLGDLYFAAASYEKSTVEYEAASKLDPKNASYLVKEGRNSLRLQTVGRGRSAVPEGDYLLDPSSAEAYLNLDELAIHRHDDSAAIRYLERAVNLQPDNSAALYELGLTYRKTGQPAKATAGFETFPRIEGFLSVDTYLPSRQSNTAATNSLDRSRANSYASRMA